METNKRRRKNKRMRKNKRRRTREDGRRRAVRKSWTFDAPKSKAGKPKTRTAGRRKR
jgi:hypothetical protein